MTDSNDFMTVYNREAATYTIGVHNDNEDCYDIVIRQDGVPIATLIAPEDAVWPLLQAGNAHPHLLAALQTIEDDPLACSCFARSWYGEGHNTQCAVRIATDAIASATPHQVPPCIKTYRVTVRQTILERYKVRARSASEALEGWSEGDFLGCDDTHLDSDPIKATEVQP